MAVQVTLKGQSQGGEAATSFQSADYSTAGAAVAAASDGFIAFANPIYPGGPGQTGAEVNVSDIDAILTIAAVTFGTVPED